MLLDQFLDLREDGACGVISSEDLTHHQGAFKEHCVEVGESFRVDQARLEREVADVVAGAAFVLGSGAVDRVCGIGKFTGCIDKHAPAKVRRVEPFIHHFKYSDHEAAGP